MTRIILSLVLAVLVPVTALHAQQRPPRTPAEISTHRKCTASCQNTVKCHIREAGCVDRIQACLVNCEGNR